MDIIYSKFLLILVISIFGMPVQSQNTYSAEYEVVAYPFKTYQSNHNDSMSNKEKEILGNQIKLVLLKKILVNDRYMKIITQIDRENSNLSGISIGSNAKSDTTLIDKKKMIKYSDGEYFKIELNSINYLPNKENTVKLKNGDTIIVKENPSIPKNIVPNYDFSGLKNGINFIEKSKSTTVLKKWEMTDKKLDLESNFKNLDTSSLKVYSPYKQ
ncbi:hypothetical protein [Mesonia aquimarina]|uniref:hypothetical protein n=1 Tax=Mesonia aquimarina TaxID=1504967 RepID=UPI000EF564AD|nr:hypothetical protein [Mesonia aquimarina]